jgi:RNA polymerase sigma factor for flagellar operon FliA
MTASQERASRERALRDRALRECASPIDKEQDDVQNAEQNEDEPIDLTAFMPLVRSIAFRIYSSIPPYASVELNDLMQSGHLGLVHAGKSYQKNRGVPFPVYARFRIRGEILDALRRLDYASRGMRRLEKRLRALQDATPTQDAAPAEEVAPGAQRNFKANDPSTDPGRVRFLRLPPIAILSLDDQRPDTMDWRAPSPGPDAIHSALETRNVLDRALRGLPPRSQELIRLYYQGGLTMREIGDRFSIKESRVSQIHRQALNSMARHLRAAGIASAAEVWEVEA